MVSLVEVGDADAKDRVKLAVAARNIIKQCLEIIGVNAPERM